MPAKWVLNKKQVFGLAVYAAILPTSLLLSSVVGSWIFVVGSLVSLPLAPLGFLVFWGAVGIGGVAAFFVTWLFNFFQGWLMLASLVARKTGL